MDNKLITTIMMIFAIIIMIGSVTVPAIDSFGSTPIAETILVFEGAGSNNYGQQGDGTTTDVTEFTQRLSTETIASVTSSNLTTWVLTTDGKLFGCGWNNAGQQGDGTTTNVTEFTQRLSTETIAKVINYDSTTWVLTTDGKLFGCGWNNAGQQGDGTKTDVTEFTQRLNDKKIVDVVCSNTTTFAIEETTKTVYIDSPYKIMLSVVPVIIIATVLVTMAVIIFRNRE